MKTFKITSQNYQLNNHFGKIIVRSHHTHQGEIPRTSIQNTFKHLSSILTVHIFKGPLVELRHDCYLLDYAT